MMSTEANMSTLYYNGRRQSAEHEQTGRAARDRSPRSRVAEEAIRTAARHTANRALH